jgi:hypothetical protein
MRIMTILLISLTFSSKIAHAAYSLHGFLQGNYSGRTSACNCSRLEDTYDFILGEERLQLKPEGYGGFLWGKGGFYGKIDLLHDDVTDEWGVKVREAYLDYSPGPFDMRLGRQIITWGTGDLLFLNDIFPKDWVAFLSGAPLEYMKIGSDALKLNLYPDWVDIELILIPYFERDNLPEGERLFAFNPFPLGTKRRRDEPDDPRWSNLEWALRLHRYLGSYDLSLYFTRSFFRAPGMRPDSVTSPTRVTLFYPKRQSLGFSLEGGMMGGVMGLEGSYYYSLDDVKGENPSIENSQTRYLVSYRKEVKKDLHLGLQYYGEYIHQYDEYSSSLPRGFPARERLRQNLTLRITRYLMHQTLKLSFFAIYSPDEEDFYLNPSLKYDINDHLWVEIGATWVGGDRDYTMLGQFEKNDNLYLAIRYTF